MSGHRWRVVAGAAAVAVLLTAAIVFVAGRNASRRGEGAPASGAAGTHSQTSAPPAVRKPVFAIYYMWWDRGHWLSRLGPSYPAQAAGTLPATLDSSGCHAATNYPGNKETDISPGLAYDQANPATINQDVQEAADAGLSGLAVNWIGTGQADQTPDSSDYNRRLAEVFADVQALNAAGRSFTLLLNYQSSAKTLPVSQFTNDISYFLRTYGASSVLDHSYSAKPEVIFAGTWKYHDADIAALSAALRSRAYLIGDEKPSSWNEVRAAQLDGTSYYWSSQNPYQNSSSFTTLRKFAATVRETRNPDGTAKTWLAPFTPGYNAALLYNTPTCVPRNGSQTLQRLFDGNNASNPDGWTLISWNEISEGSYVVPLRRYGTTYTTALHQLLTGAR